MATISDYVTVLVGPTCPTCESDELRWGAPLGALWHGQCRDCGTEYRWYEPDSADIAELTCPGCAMPHDPARTGSSHCDDCRPTPCAFCGRESFLAELSINRACAVCETGEAA
jgi:hypothetical protein